MWFVFALVWSFGSALYHDGSSDYKTEFSKWFQTEFHSITNIEFPAFTSVFDLYVDPATQVLLLLNDKYDQNKHIQPL